MLGMTKIKVTESQIMIILYLNQEKLSKNIQTIIKMLNLEGF